MNLLNILTQAMSTDDSVQALSKRSGASGSQLGSLISLALPLLQYRLLGVRLPRAPDLRDDEVPQRD